MIRPQKSKPMPRKPKVERAETPRKRVKVSRGKQTISKNATAQEDAPPEEWGMDKTQPHQPESVPLELAGKWIAWSGDGLRIIGSGLTLDEAEQAAAQAGEKEPIFQRIAGVGRR